MLWPFCQSYKMLFFPSLNLQQPWSCENTRSFNVLRPAAPQPRSAPVAFPHKQTQRGINLAFFRTDPSGSQNVPVGKSREKLWDFATPLATMNGSESKELIWFSSQGQTNRTRFSIVPRETWWNMVKHGDIPQSNVKVSGKLQCSVTAPQTHCLLNLPVKLPVKVHEVQLRWHLSHWGWTTVWLDTAAAVQTCSQWESLQWQQGASLFVKGAYCFLLSLNGK